MTTNLDLLPKREQAGVEIYQSDKEMINSSAYDKSTKEIMLRAISTRFCDLVIEDQVKVITTELEQAYIRNGTDKDSDEIKAFTVSEVIDLFSKRRQITHSEVTYIFKHGSLGLFGKNYGINVKSINDWIVAFYEDQTRIHAIKKLNDLKKAVDEVKLLSPADCETVMVKMVKEIYYERNQNGFSDTEMLSHPVYDILKSKGLIDLSEDQKTELKEEAEDLIDRARYESDRESPIGKQLNYARFQSDVIKVAKVLAVRDYFNYLSENNQEIPL